MSSGSAPKTSAGWPWWSPQVMSAGANGVLIVVGLLADLVPWPLRIVVLVLCLGLVVGAYLWAQRRQMRQEEEHSELVAQNEATLANFRAIAESLDVDDTLDGLAQRVVPEGAWRLSVYEFDGHDTWVRLARRASDPYYESGGRQRLGRDSSMLRMLSARSLRGQAAAVEYTGEFPDRGEDPDAWLDAQEGWLLPRDQAEHLRFPARRYAFAAIRLDGARGPLVAVVMEVEDPASLEKHLFEQHITRDLLTMIVKLQAATDLVARTQLLL